MASLEVGYEAKVSLTRFNSTLSVNVTPYVLTLRTPFRTSHSSSSTRTNALIKLKLGEYTGVGEVGLPPKKIGCYEADYKDVVVFAKDFVNTLLAQQSTTTTVEKPSISLQYDAFSAVKNAEFFKVLRTNNGAIQALFQALDTVVQSPERRQKAEKMPALCGFELALFDLCGQLYKSPVHELIQATITTTTTTLTTSGETAGKTKTTEGKVHPCLDGSYNRSYYTAGLDTDISLMVESAKFGLKHTPLLKIKLNGDLQLATQILEQLYTFHLSQCNNDHTKFLYAIDANSSWSPAQALEFIPVLQKYSDLGVLHMVEQPFPLWKGDQTTGAIYQVGKSGSRVYLHDSPELTAEFEAWKAVKGAYSTAGIALFGDESIATAADVIALAGIMHGVNIKLEKAGGYRGALSALETARGLDLSVWIGTMVGSIVTCTAAAQLLRFATHQTGDVDGMLLVSEECQTYQGGITWPNAVTGEIRYAVDPAVGFGLAPK